MWRTHKQEANLPSSTPRSEAGNKRENKDSRRLVSTPSQAIARLPPKWPRRQSVCSAVKKSSGLGCVFRLLVFVCWSPEDFLKFRFEMFSQRGSRRSHGRRPEMLTEPLLVTRRSAHTTQLNPNPEVPKFIPYRAPQIAHRHAGKSGSPLPRHLQRKTKAARTSSTMADLGYFFSRFTTDVAPCPLFDERLWLFVEYRCC